MNVLFVDQFSEWGGAQLGLRDVIEEGLRRNWKIHLMAPRGPLTKHCKDRGVHIEHLLLSEYANGKKTLLDSVRFIPDMLRCGRAIRHAVRERRIDLVVANGPRILPAMAGVRCPVVFHAHSSPGKRYARELAAWFGRRSGTHVIAVSRFASQWIRSENIEVIYNGVVDQGYQEPSGNRAALRIGIIGRIAPEKGQAHFVRAAREVAATHPHVQFAVIGTSLYSNASYEQAVRELAKGLPVEFPGWTRTIASTLHGLDILAVPSSSIEAATRVIMEAFSAGTPVIAYPSGGIPELVRDGETGVLTSAADHRALADAIRLLIDDPSLMPVLARNGRREWEKRFRLDRFQTEICDSLERAASAVPGTPPSNAALHEGP